MIETGRRKPIIWVLLGSRTGDNSQALAVAEIAGGKVLAKMLAYNAAYRTPNLLLGASLRSLRPDQRSMVAPPWPDLVIGVGRRSVPVARWIREQSAGAAKLVHIGRPRAPLDWFDLVLTTPQYRLPDGPYVLNLLLPPLSAPAVSPEELERWRRTFAPLPRPWIGVLVGGARPPYRFDSRDALQLARQADALAERLGGSLLVTTSPRTGAAQSRALAEATNRPAYRNLWQPGGDNAHGAILALADRFIVTSDSASMLAEACMAGKPVAIHQLPRHRLYPTWSGRTGFGRRLARAGLATPPRDPQALVRRLVDGGHAALLGSPEPASFVPVPDERIRIREAIKRVLAPR